MADKPLYLLRDLTLQNAQTVTIVAVSNTTYGSTGTTPLANMVFVGSDGVSIGVSNGSIIFKGGAAGGGGVALSAGTQSAGGGTVVFSNSNGISFGMSGSSRITASYTVPGATVFSNSNNVTFGLNGSTVTASVTVVQSTQPVAVSGSNGSFAFSTVTWGALNGASFYTSNGSMVMSYTVPTQTVQPGIQSIQVSNTTYTTGNVIFSNANGISFGSSAGGAITASYTVPTVTNSSMTVSDSATSGSVARLAFTNLNGVTLSLSTGAGGSHTIVGSVVTSYLTSQSNQNVTAANGGFAFQTLSFSNVNNISFGTSAGSAITASYSQSNQNISFFALGNTTQNSSTVLGANVVSFNGAGNMTVGFSNGSIQLSAPAGGGAAVTVSDNATSGTVGRLAFTNLNGVTLSLSTGAGGSHTIVGSHNAITSQSNQNMSLFALGNTTQNSSTLLNASNMSYNAIGSLTIGFSNGSIQFSAPNALTSQSNQAFSAGAASSAFQTLSFQDSNGISFSNNAGAIRLTHDLQFTSNTSAITANALNTSASRVINIIGATNNTGGGTASLSSNVSFSNANGATFYTSAGNAIVLSYSVPTQSVQPGIQSIQVSNTTWTTGNVIFSNANGISFASSAGGGVIITHDLQYTSNTSAITSNALNTSASRVFNIVVATNNTGGGTSSMSSNVSFGALNGMTFYQSNGSIVASYTDAGAGGGISAVVFSAGAGNSALSNVNFSNSNGVSWGINGSTITADVGLNLYAVGNTTQNSSTTVDIQSISFNAVGGGITAGFSNGSIQLSVVPTETRSSFEVYPAAGLSTVLVGVPTGTSAGVSVYPFLLDEYVTAGMLNLAYSVNFLTVGTSSGRQTVGMAYALYTRNGSTLSSLWSQSLSFQVTGNNSSYTVSQVTDTQYTGFVYSTTASAGSNISSGYTGMKLIALPVNTLLTPGQYWLGIIGTNSTSSVNVGLSFSQLGAAIGTGLSALAPVGSFSSAYTTANPGALGGRWYSGAGSWTSAGSVTMVPASMRFNSISAVGLTIPMARFWYT